MPTKIRLHSNVQQAVRLGGRHNMPPPPADRRPISGQFVVRGGELPTAYMRAKLEDRSFFRLRNIEGVRKLSKLGHVPQATPT